MSRTSEAFYAALQKTAMDYSGQNGAKVQRKSIMRTQDMGPIIAKFKANMPPVKPGVLGSLAKIKNSIKTHASNGVSTFKAVSKI